MLAPNRSSSTQLRAWFAAGVFVLALLGLGVLSAIPVARDGSSVFGQPSQPTQNIGLVTLTANRRTDRRSVEERAMWRDAAEATALAIEEIEVATLDDLGLGRFGIWILPRQQILSESDVAAIDAFLGSGGGVLLSGPTGLQKAPREPRVVLPLELFFPGRSFESIDKTPANVHVNQRGPLVVGLSPGQRIRIRPEYQALIARGAGGLIWQSGAGAGESARGALLQGLHRGSPVVWLGLRPERISDPKLAAVLLENALRFAMRRPVLELQPWPDGRAAAALIATDALSEPEQIGRVSRIHSERGVPLINAAGVRDCSIDPLSEDPNTLRALQARGCRFVATSTTPSHALEISDRSGSPLVLLPGTLRKGSRVGLEEWDTRSLIRSELNRYDRVEREGGLYSLTYDADWIASPQGPRALDRLFAELTRRGVWFASGDELADWWLSRRDVHANLIVDRPGSARVVLRNEGRTAARGITARVYLPPDARSPVPSRPQILGTPDTLRVAADRSWVEFVTPVLDPGDQVLYTLRF